VAVRKIRHNPSKDLGVERTLDQLDAFSLQTQRAITIPLIKDMLNEL
jgi:chromosomal replication initiation ATPase DnaA